MAAPHVAVLFACAQKLRKLREAGDPTVINEILEILTEVEAVPIVTRETLSRTGAGLEVNNKFLRVHSDASVKERARALVHKWKAIVCPQANSETQPTPSADFSRLKRRCTSSSHPGEELCRRGDGSLEKIDLLKKSDTFERSDSGTHTRTDKLTPEKLPMPVPASNPVAASSKRDSGASQTSSPDKTASTWGAAPMPEIPRYLSRVKTPGEMMRDYRAKRAREMMEEDD